MIVRVYLAFVGLLYVGLAVYCAAWPAEAARKVGFRLEGDSGRSEFLTVYGGLELGLALIFLLPLWRSDVTQLSLLACLLVHGSLVVCRSISLMLYRDFTPMTAKLAVGEWTVFLLTVGMVFAVYSSRIKT